MNVCIVDDELLIREGIEKRLVKYGYPCEKIWKAADAHSAAEILKREPIDLVFADINMPFMNGLQMIETYRRPDLHFVIVSGYDRFDYAKKAIELGVEAYLLKPIEKAEFQKVMDQMMEKIEIPRQVAEMGSGLRRVMDCIREHWQDPAFCLQDCAVVMGLSESYINKLLKKEGGASFVDLLNQYRIDQAVKQLQKSEGRIQMKELAQQCGFTTPQYFSTVFRKHTGITPSQMKEKQR
jgi:two-component system response regulator YesN